MKYHKNTGNRLVGIFSYASISNSVIFLAIISSIIATTAPIIQPYLLNQLLGGGDRPTISTYGFALLVLLIVGAIARAVEQYTFGIAGENIAANFRRQLVKHLLSGHIIKVEQWSKGEIASRLGADITQVKSAFSDGYFRLPKSIILVIGSAICMACIDIKLFTIVFILLIIIFIAFLLSSRKLNGYSKNYHDEVGLFSERIVQFIEGFRILKVSNSLKQFGNYLSISIRGIEGRGRVLAAFDAILGSISNLTLQLSLLVVLAYGGLRVIGNTITMEGLISFILYLSVATSAFGEAFGCISFIQKGEGAFKRVQPIFDIPLEKTNGVKKTLENQSIIFKDIEFSYGASEKLLKDFTLNLEHGSTTVIVGPSGAGKSTVLAMLLRIITPQKGVISIGGQDISCMDLYALRDLFAYVDQNSMVIPGTVRENLLIGNPKVKDVDLIRALHDVGLDTRFKENGLDTVLGEAGAQLSGGQRQRLVIARAIASNKPILLLDEPTSALDGESEDRIFSSELLQGTKTKLIVSHRVSIAQHADNVVVMKNGAIEAFGKHAELLKISNYYRAMWEREGKINLD